MPSFPPGVFICTRGQRRATCVVCRAPAPLLCDGVTRERPGRTCDAQLCSRCATKIRGGGKKPLDYCPWCLNAHLSSLPVAAGGRAR